VTTDIYANAGDHNVQSGAWGTLYGLSGGQRILALAEVGVIPDPELQVSQNIPWCYWVTWAGNYIEDGNYNSRQFLCDVYSDSHVVTLDGVTKLGSWENT
jgi:mannan endo-1,4-beta-mannosidase